MCLEEQKLRKCSPVQAFPTDIQQYSYLKSFTNGPHQKLQLQLFLVSQLNHLTGTQLLQHLTLFLGVISLTIVSR